MLLFLTAMKDISSSFVLPVVGVTVYKWHTGIRNAPEYVMDGTTLYGDNGTKELVLPLAQLSNLAVLAEVPQHTQKYYVMSVDR